MGTNTDIIDLSSFVISADMLNQIAEIDEFKGEWKYLTHLNPERLRSLKTVATIESIGSSTRIEGSKLTDQEIELLLTGIRSDSIRSRDEQEVLGYAFVSDHIYENYAAMPLSENMIRQLHLWLLKYSDRDVNHRGEYKKIPIRIEAFDSNGKSIGVIFETTSPFETPLKMKKLIEWIGIVLENKTIHPLIAIGIFTVLFLAIHPFQDGNGRLSRLLTTLLMLKCDYGYVSYSSLESIIEANKESYYQALQSTQKSWQQNRPNWTPWLHFFFTSLQRQKRHLEIKLEGIKKLSERIPPVHQQILECLKLHGPLKIGEIQTLTRINRNTLKKNLEVLVKGKKINALGIGKATQYKHL